MEIPKLKRPDMKCFSEENAWTLDWEYYFTTGNKRYNTNKHNPQPKNKSLM